MSPENRHSSAIAAVPADNPPRTSVSPWIARWAGLIADGARVLDLASGSGRNLAPLLARSVRLLAADRDPVALRGLPPQVEPLPADLEAAPWPLAAGSFDAVICCNYLFRPRLALLAGLLAPGGMLLYETFAQGNAVYGRPANPDYLLAPGELLALAQRGGLHVLAYEDGVVESPKPARIQRLCAIRAPADMRRLRLDAGVG